MSKNTLKNLKLLYVEDEESTKKYAMSYFNRIFDTTYEASNVDSALEIYRNEKPHIIVTDIKMEDLSGIDLIKEIRKNDKECQIIVLSAFLDTKYLLEAVKLNLVQYITKPIDHDEIYPALVQCAKNLKDSTSDLIYFSNDSYFNTMNKTLVFENTEMKLSQKEIELLDFFCLNKTRLVSYQEIENTVWYDLVMSDNALRIIIKKLRKKLPLNTLENIPRVGYKIKTTK